jgi:DeoR family suf operon transcriptional repressor
LWIESRTSNAQMLLGQSKFKIIRALLEGDRTAERMARALRLSITAVRKHVEAMEQAGLVSSRFERASLGRPKKVYFVTEEGRDFMSRKYDAFLVSLLGKLSAADKGFARHILRSVASDMASQVRAGIPEGARATREEKLGALTSVLNQIGFLARVEKSKDGTGSRLVRTNCVILWAAKRHPDLVCKVFDTAFLKAVLGQDVKLLETMACGSKQCVHAV